MMGAGNSSSKIVVVICTSTAGSIVTATDTNTSATCLETYYRPSWEPALAAQEFIKFVPEPRPKQYWKNRFERIGRKRGNTR